MVGELLVFSDLRREGIPYSRNWLDQLIKRKLFPPGRRLTRTGRRYWTHEEVEAAKKRMASMPSDSETII
jgi:hypothetical protein